MQDQRSELALYGLSLGQRIDTPTARGEIVAARRMRSGNLSVRVQGERHWHLAGRIQRELNEQS